MRMIFLPGDSSLQAIVETQSYKDIWRHCGLDLLKVFERVTGLTFQQRQITARIHPQKYGESGNGRRAMTLPGNCRTASAQRIVLTHELGHRLLSGNILHGVRFGFSRPRWGAPEDPEEELEHRLLNLFLGDVIHQAFGDAVYADFADLESCEPMSPHGKAYIWATQMSDFQRRAMVSHIMADAMPRDMWDGYDPAHVIYVGTDAYQDILNNLRDTIKK